MLIEFDHAEIQVASGPTTSRMSDNIRKCYLIRRVLRSSICHLLIVCAIFCIIVLTQPKTTRQYINFRVVKSHTILKRHTKHGQGHKHGTGQGHKPHVQDIKHVHLPHVNNKEPVHQFQDYNTKDVVTMHNVCIELDTEKPSTVKNSKRGSLKRVYPRKQLVSYGNTKAGVKHILAGSSSHDKHPTESWTVHLRTGNISKSAHLVKKHVAYFIHTKDSSLFLNFWKNLYSGLFSVIRKTKRLNSNSTNVIFTKHNLNRMVLFKNMYMTLNVHPIPSVFHSSNKNICYKHAVFGIIKNTQWKDPADHLLHYLGIDKKKCKVRTVTILQSSSLKQIVNTESIKRKLTDAQSLHVQVVVITKVTVNKLLEILSCSDVLITSQVLGQPWIAFLRPSSIVLEVLWPPDMAILQNLNKNHDLKLKVQTLSKKEIQPQVNREAYSKACKKGHQLDNITKEAILKSTSKTGLLCSNVYNFANVFVQPNAILKRIQNALHP